MYMGYFKRKRTNKKKGKRGTKRYRGGATNATVQEKKDEEFEMIYKELKEAKNVVDQKMTNLEGLYSKYTGGAFNADLSNAVEYLNTEVKTFSEISQRLFDAIPI
jgi:hypothetical protein